MPRIEIDALEPEVYDATDPCGPGERLGLGDAAGLTRFGVAIETLRPGSRSSDRHWHEAQDEFLMMLDGEAVLIEDGGETVLHAGECAGWKAGVADAHHLINRSDADIRFLVVGTRTETDTVHYPDLGRRTEHLAGGRWRAIADDGTVLREGGAD